MGEFAAAVFSFPAMVCTFALIVVALFWLCVLVGALEHDTFDTGAGADALGLGGVPVTVSVSLLVALSWALSTTGGILLHRAHLPSSGNMAAGTGVLVGAIAVSWAATRMLVRPLRHLFPDEPGPSRLDLVGRTCTIRTGRVDAHFGQAEVATRDGGTAIVQVRQHGTDSFSAGVTGLLYAYDDTGEFFWVAPFEAALDPGSPAV
ncbi:hypothetical protein LO772_03640 [Yinghuangia sp. ASG 101]|uniref:hypothetical protein n=1 Tax=Yinghuangia sp. ASG 101 TaxID=2896848 RepID=UPI001E2C6FA8|nr:hypothetical protein [Yinghuangia sp. ASG 101]UGQ12726.1 hypothetical protein LO772_03640 [Yinghuangia sp. ASG 101]